MGCFAFANSQFAIHKNCCKQIKALLKSAEQENRERERKIEWEKERLRDRERAIASVAQSVKQT